MLRRIWPLIVICCMVSVDAYTAVRPNYIRKFDQYGDICCEDEKARLDNFAVALQNAPDAVGYIIFYGGRRHSYPYCYSRRRRLPRRGEASARASRIKPYLVNARGIDSKQIVLINGGYQESWTADLWIVPKGATAPEPTPTVKPEEIRFRKGRATIRQYFCEE
jgi:hypothetical protein